MQTHLFPPLARAVPKAFITLQSPSVIAFSLPQCPAFYLVWWGVFCFQAKLLHCITGCCDSSLLSDDL